MNPSFLPAPTTIASFLPTLRAAALIGFNAIVGPSAAMADVVLEWNAVARASFDQGAAEPALVQARVFALLNLAMRDAIATSGARTAEPGDERPEHAAAAAAYQVLITLLPRENARLTVLHARKQRPADRIETKDPARQIGRSAAAALLASRQDDGWTQLVPAGVGEVPPPLPAQLLVPPLPASWARAKPFSLKRPQQISPEPPYFAYADGVVLPNDRLRSTRLLGPQPGGEALPAFAPWSTHAVTRWNEAGAKLAALRPGGLLSRARELALLHVALADALLAAAYWSAHYGTPRWEEPIALAGQHDAALRAIESDPRAVSLTGQPSWLAGALRSYPASPAAAAGAAEAVLAALHRGVPFSLAFATGLPAAGNEPPREFSDVSAAARECAWSPLAEREAGPEACVAGFDLGRRIGQAVIKQMRR